MMMDYEEILTILRGNKKSLPYLKFICKHANSVIERKTSIADDFWTDSVYLVDTFHKIEPYYIAGGHVVTNDKTGEWDISPKEYDFTTDKYLISRSEDKDILLLEIALLQIKEVYHPLVRLILDESVFCEFVQSHKVRNLIEMNEQRSLKVKNEMLEFIDKNISVDFYLWLYSEILENDDVIFHFIESWE